MLSDAPSGLIRREEMANALTHGAGALLGLAGLAMLIYTSLSLQSGLTAHVLAVGVYGTSLVAVYVASTLYHAAAGTRWKARLRRLDQSCIFALIAGTYTPFAVTALSGLGQASLLIAIWGVCAAGAVATSVSRRHSTVISLSLYALAALPGAAVVHLVRPLPGLIGPAGAALLLGGGVWYAIGVFFYLRRAAYAHTVWHLCVLAGSGLHYICVLRYAGPRA